MSFGESSMRSIIRIPVLGLAVLCLMLSGVGLREAHASKSPSWLFVQETSSGEVVKVGKESYRLVLTAPSASVSKFTDRPGRVASQESLKAFLGEWSSNGFKKDPPNAALVVHGRDKTSDVMILTLSNPRYSNSKGTLSYTAKPLKKQAGGSLAELQKRRDTLRAMKFKTASVFIDDAGSGMVFLPVTFQITSFAGGQITLDVSSDSGIGWSVARNTPAPGLTYVAQQGGPSIQLMQVSTSEILIQTPTGAGAGQISLTMYLAGPMDAGGYTLTASSNTSATIVAVAPGPDGPLFNTLSSAPSFFPWLQP